MNKHTRAIWREGLNALLAILLKCWPNEQATGSMTLKKYWLTVLIHKTFAGSNIMSWDKIITMAARLPDDLLTNKLVFSQFVDCSTHGLYDFRTSYWQKCLVENLEMTSPQLDWLQAGLLANCPVRIRSTIFVTRNTALYCFSHFKSWLTTTPKSFSAETSINCIPSIWYSLGTVISKIHNSALINIKQHLHSHTNMNIETTIILMLNIGKR